MQSRAKLFGHPIHQMLVVLPLGLLVMAVLFDLMDAVTGRTGWSLSSFWNIVAGVVTGVLAAVFGLADWLAIPAGTRAKRVGALHGLGNVVVLTLFTLVAVLRWTTPGHEAPAVAFVLELCGLALGVVTGWLGGELVDRLGIGVDEGAHANAPSSMSHEHISKPMA
jgi:uncharacterized membrane protein